MNDVKSRKVYSFNNTMHGGFNVTIEWHDNGDGEFFATQTLSLHANCNLAEIQLNDNSFMTPEKLRELANIIETETFRLKQEKQK